MPFVSAGPMWLFCCEKCGSVRDTLHSKLCPWWIEGRTVSDDQCAYPVRRGEPQPATYVHKS